MRKPMRGAGPETTDPQARSFRYRISVLLMALAVVPLTGVSWFTVSEVRSAEAARRQATDIGATATHLVLLTELKSHVQDERNWSAARAAIIQLGVDSELVHSVTGLDIPGELAQTRAQVDELTAELQLNDVALSLAEARTADPTEDLLVAGEPYSDIDTRISEESQRTLDALLLIAGQTRDGRALVATLRMLEYATVAEEAVAREFTAFFGFEFASAGTNASTNLANLLGQQAIRTKAQADLRRTTTTSARSYQALAAIDASPDAQAFDQAINQLVDQALKDQARPGAGGQGGTLSAITGNLDGVVTVFKAAKATTALQFNLVTATSDDVQQASADLGVSARRQLDRALASVAGLAAVSLLFAAAATRAVVRPVRRLADVARRISDGDATARFASAGGSVEIRDAGRAMDAAAAHLELAEQQAKALADGDLDHPVLSRVTTGQLGASLQDAVRALASSLQEREEFRRRMTHEATHDGLTQIANRNASLAQLRRGLSRVNRSEGQLAVLFIDLDGFKDINDTYGHHAGDQVIRTTAQRLVNGVRNGDHVGRLGGDEFLVIAEPVTGPDEAVALAHRLLDELSEPIAIDHATVSLSASIGIALSHGHDEAASTELLRDADLAVYKAKSDGRGRVEICDSALRSAVFERADIERALHQAILNLEFVLHYQPIIEPTSGSLCGFEALIRWHRPGHGMVPPDSFIPVAERSDLILAIDQWVLGAAVRQIRAWDDEGLYPGVPVSVNVSGRHLGSPSLIDDVLSPLRDHGVDPSRLVVEITESALLEDLEGAAAKLQTLRSQGIRVAIDDFGTGYTSLAHLKSLPIDILKIDRSYTNDASAASLVKLIIDTGHLLGATITAEGIETVDQAFQLTAMGTDELQGYLYGRPAAPADLQPPSAWEPVLIHPADRPA